MRGLGLASLVAVFTSFAASAQEIDLVGESGWERWNARRIEIFAEEIANYRDRGFSGPLRMEIVATPDQPTDGDFSNGYTIASLRLRELAGGDSYFDLDYLVRYNAPPAGLYYTSIVLDEFTDAGWQLLDWEDFPGIVNFGGIGSGEATADEPVLLSADTIVNEGAKRSGLLRMRLWATVNPYDGALLDGYLLANKPLGKLKSGFQIQNYSRNAPFHHPPEGSYYITLTLEEKSGRGWFIRDWVNFPGQSIF
jgi:hypothetical protein